MTARRRWAWPLVPVYGAVLALEDAFRAAGFFGERRLDWPVVSVGSLSAGGAGKTPVVIALAGLLAKRGWRIDVLSRGYGRAGSGVRQVDRALKDAARLFGDEPTLIAERTGVPVWVGASRFWAGRAAEQREGELRGGAERARGTEPCVHLLDDGLQHRSLTRQFDLVLVTEEDLKDTLLPAGNLREPLTALRRADAVAVREEELEGVTARVRALAGSDVPLWTIRRTVRFPPPLGVFGAGLRPLAFCALARPAGFAEMLGKAGCGVVDTVIFADHHCYDERDVRELVRLAGQLQATGLVTTEKDAVKLSPKMRARLQDEIGPLMVVALDVSFVYESPVVRGLESKLFPRDKHGEPIEARAL